MTDAFLAGDVFDVFDFGALIDSTALVPPDVSCGDDPDVCLVDPTVSHGSFTLAAGAHSITITPSVSPYTAGAAYFRVDLGTWTRKANLAAPVEGASVCVDPAFIVAAYGLSNIGDTNATRVYSVAAKAWAAGAPGPLPVRSEGIGVYRDGQCYSIGGRSNVTGIVLNNLDRYNKNANQWVALAPMPTARAGLGGAVSGRYIYAIGGRTTLAPCGGGALATVERYDTQTNTWAPLAPLPAARSDAGAIAMGNGKIYVFGGCDAFQNVVGDVFIYNIVSNTWRAAPFGMPTPRAAFYQVGFVGPKIYVMGGFDSTQNVSAANEVFSIITSTWSVATPMTTPRGEMGVGSVGGNIWTVGGGVPAFGTPTNVLEVFTP